MQSRERSLGDRRPGGQALGGLALALLLEGCSPGAPPAAIQPSAAPTASASAQQTAATPTMEPVQPPWRLAEELPTLHRATTRTPSGHLTGELDGEVLANDAAKAYPALGPRLAFPPGATLLERHLPHGAETTAVYFAMVKRAAGYDPDSDDWEYLVVDPEGRIEERGRLPLCRRCHAEAPHDHLFGAGR